MIWAVMILTGIFTFGTRFIMLTGWVTRSLPNWLIDALGFVPIAVLTSIIVPAVLIDPTTNEVVIINNPRLVAAVVATIVALITQNVIATIGSGLVIVWLMQWWF